MSSYFVPVYRKDIGRSVELLAYLKPMTAHIGYPELGKIYDWLKDQINDELDENPIECQSIELKIIYEIPQAYFQLWNKQTRLTFEERISNAEMQQLLDKHRVFNVNITLNEYQEENTPIPRLFW
jgi:hypothetical protein